MPSVYFHVDAVAFCCFLLNKTLLYHHDNFGPVSVTCLKIYVMAWYFLQELVWRWIHPVSYGLPVDHWVTMVSFWGFICIGMLGDVTLCWKDNWFWSYKEELFAAAIFCGLFSMFVAAQELLVAYTRLRFDCSGENKCMSVSLTSLGVTWGAVSLCFCNFVLAIMASCSLRAACSPFSVPANMFDSTSDPAVLCMTLGWTLVVLCKLGLPMGTPALRVAFLNSHLH
jgi:hypothetical protein